MHKKEKKEPGLGGRDSIWTVSMVSEYFQLTPETIRSLARKGKIPAFKVGRSWRFRKSDILKLGER